MLEIGPNLFHASGPDPAATKAELVAICIVRNEMWRLPFFLAYHRWLGIQHFIIIDNRSTDGTIDYMRREGDVTCIVAPGNYGGKPAGHKEWLRWALRLAPPQRWNLLLDADELFVGKTLQSGSLLPLVRRLSTEDIAIVTTSLVDCYPARFPLLADFEPVPWHRAPYFDRGPYFQWPSQEWPVPHIHHGVRERICWPHWRWFRKIKRVIPRPLRPSILHDAPPWVIKMPLLRNVPGLVFDSVHYSSGLRRSVDLFALLHYKFDIDLTIKVDVALRERQHAQQSREYEGYARLLSKPRSDLRCDRSCSFDGVQSLIDAGLVRFERGIVRGDLRDPSLSKIVEQVWQYGDLALQKEAWERAWMSAPLPVS
jgi:glycosyltransferase involved in cell wall biosynthesis